MPVGPNKYDHLATLVGESADAEAVVVIVIGGNDGSGFSVQATASFIKASILGKILHEVADRVEEIEAVEDE
jgi:hypothetical protein